MLITHSSECARFLGYDIRVRKSQAIKCKHSGNRKIKKRTLNGSVELLVPLNDKIHKFIFSKKIAVQKNDRTLFLVHRKYLISSTDLEIVTIYNAELRGICNYYSLSVNFNKLSYFAYLMEYSCLKTIASRHKSSISKVIGKYRCGKKWGVPYETKSGSKIRFFADYSECKNTMIIPTLSTMRQLFTAMLSTPSKTGSRLTSASFVVRQTASFMKFTMSTSSKT